MKTGQTLLDIAGIVATVRPDGSLNILSGAREYAELLGGVGSLAMRRSLAQPKPATNEFPGAATRARVHVREGEAG